jgi:hypothetical protein
MPSNYVTADDEIRESVLPHYHEKREDPGHGPDSDCPDCLIACGKRVVRYKIHWDIEHAAGTFPEVYTTEGEAQEVADAIWADNLAEGIWDSTTCSIEVIEVEVPRET